MPNPAVATFKPIGSKIFVQKRTRSENQANAITKTKTNSGKDAEINVSANADGVDYIEKICEAQRQH